MLITQKPDITQRKRSGKYRFSLPIVAAITFLLSACNSFAQVGYKDGFRQSVFLGHSYFKPGALDIKELAPYAGYHRHSDVLQFKGGKAGDVGSLWENEEETLAKDTIKEGGVELIAVTWYNEPDDNEVGDYQNWINLALEHNADTFDTFVIQSVWPNAYTTPDYEDAEALQEEINAIINGIVRSLRSDYPDLTILHMPVGQAMIKLWELYLQGKLGPEIQGVTIPGNDQNTLQKRFYRAPRPHYARCARLDLAANFIP